MKYTKHFQPQQKSHTPTTFLSYPFSARISISLTHTHSRTTYTAAVSHISLARSFYFRSSSRTHH